MKVIVMRRDEEEEIARGEAIAKEYIDNRGAAAYAELTAKGVTDQQLTLAAAFMLYRRADWYQALMEMGRADSCMSAAGTLLGMHIHEEEEMAEGDDA